jgi:hypothetical protein
MLMDKKQDQAQQVLHLAHQPSILSPATSQWFGLVYHVADGLLSSLMTRTELVLETFLYLPFNHLMQLLA